jgi:hypothetical protein
MERKTSKLQQHESAELEAQSHASATPAGSVFENVDELIRHDAAQTSPPPHLEERLAISVEDIPPAPRSWWQRWLRP